MRRPREEYGELEDDNDSLDGETLDGEAAHLQAADSEGRLAKGSEVADGYANAGELQPAVDRHGLLQGPPKEKAVRSIQRNTSDVSERALALARAGSANSSNCKNDFMQFLQRHRQQEVPGRPRPAPRIRLDESVPPFVAERQRLRESPCRGHEVGLQ